MHLIGIKPPDEKWLRMKRVWDSCVEAGVSPPKPVTDFFGHSDPDDAGVVVELSSYSADKQHPCCEDWMADMGSGFEVELAKLPPDVKRLRFWVSY